MTDAPAYRVRGLVKSYRDGAVAANSGIDLDVAVGELFGLLGPNGAGKSTLVRQLAGLTRPDAGAIELLGHDVVAQPDLAGCFVAYLAQEELALAELPVGLAIDTTARLRGLSRRDAAATTRLLLDELALGPYRDRALLRLSGGERRLAYVAAALAGDRAVLLLDEPTTGLDAVARRSVWAAVQRRRREHGSTVVLVTHNVTEAELLLDRVAILDRGRVIACDTPGRLKAQVSGDVRLELVWREAPPLTDPAVAALAGVATGDDRRWTVRLPLARARHTLGELTTGAAFEALDDFTLATPSLEDVYLALGGLSDDLERQ